MGALERLDNRQAQGATRLERARPQGRFGWLQRRSPPVMIRPDVEMSFPAQHAGADAQMLSVPGLDGSCVTYAIDGEIWRAYAMDSRAWVDWLLGQTGVQAAMQAGLLVATTAASGDDVLLQHERVPVVFDSSDWLPADYRADYARLQRLLWPHGLIAADPKASNVGRHADGRWVWVDFGNVGPLTSWRMALVVAYLDGWGGHCLDGRGALDRLLDGPLDRVASWLGRLTRLARPAVRAWERARVGRQYRRAIAAVAHGALAI